MHRDGYKKIEYSLMGIFVLTCLFFLVPWMVAVIFH